MIVTFNLIACFYLPYIFRSTTQSFWDIEDNEELQPNENEGGSCPKRWNAIQNIQIHQFNNTCSNSVRGRVPNWINYLSSIRWDEKYSLTDWKARQSSALLVYSRLICIPNSKNRRFCPRDNSLTNPTRHIARRHPDLPSVRGRSQTVQINWWRCTDTWAKAELELSEMGCNSLTFSPNISTDKTSVLVGYLRFYLVGLRL